jgi:serine/threonine protein kinase
VCREGAMKQCPFCQTDYTDEKTTCPNDGAVLLSKQEWPPGTLIRGKYRILATLGRGGMGVVYKAQHMAMEELRALKVMSPQLASDPTFLHRFKQEAQAAHRLQDPHVVRVDDLDQAEDGSLFISMEYIDGGSLRDLLRATPGPLTLVRALHIARCAAHGLSAAHAQGMVHRDIKPDNILGVGLETKTPKVADFGIVAMKEGSNTLGPQPLLTAAYGAPEQWKMMAGSELDGRTDLYALGMVLYEMVAGRLPFEGKTMEQWMHAHLEQVPTPPSQFQPELAKIPGVDKLVLKMIAKAREARPKDAQEVVRLLNLLENEAALPWERKAIGRAVQDAKLGKKPLFGEPTKAQIDREPVVPLGTNSPPIPAAVESSEHVAGPQVQNGRNRVVVRFAIVAFVLLLLGIAIRYAYHNWMVSGPPQHNAAIANSVLSYYITAQDFYLDQPTGQPYLVSEQQVFAKGVGIRFVFSSPELSYLYILNEGSGSSNSSPVFNILFPSPSTNNGSAQLLPGQSLTFPEGGPLVFDNRPGSEKVWLVWSKRSIEELESLKKWANSKDRGRVEDLEQANKINLFLNQSASFSPKVSKDSSNHTNLTATGDMLMYLVRLEHR